MTLNEFLIKKKITSQKFASKIKVSISSVNKWRMPGYRIPRAKWIAKIERATKGWVKTEDWYH